MVLNSKYSTALTFENFSASRSRAARAPLHGLKLSLGERASCLGKDSAGQGGRGCSTELRRTARRQLVQQCGIVAALLTSRHKLSRVLPMVIFCRKYTRVLTFENLCQPSVSSDLTFLFYFFCASPLPSVSSDGATASSSAATVSWPGADGGVNKRVRAPRSGAAPPPPAKAQGAVVAPPDGRPQLAKQV